MMLTKRKQPAMPLPPGRRDESPVAKEKPSQADASQQAWRQAEREEAGDMEPGESAVPTRVPTRSIRESERNSEGLQYGILEGSGVGVCTELPLAGGFKSTAPSRSPLAYPLLGAVLERFA